MEGIVATIFLLLCIASTGSSIRSPEARGHFHGGSSGHYDVRDYGAVGDGETDDSKAFLAAWQDACYGDQGGTSVTLLVPNLVFLLSPLEFEGPCNSPNIKVQIFGTIVAPNNCGAYGGKTKTWIKFSHVNGLTVNGGGTIDGKGSIWWNEEADERPTAIRFEHCNGLTVSGTRHLNSQRNHISLDRCNEVDIFHLLIQAPQDSPNTDGIDICASTSINIHDSLIATGDDCIAINSKTSNLNITGIRCGPGHGISVGSLGKDDADDTVEQVNVKNCTLSGTENGVRIKTWQGWTGYVRDITFEDITLRDSRHPIIIDQHYVDKYVDKYPYIGLGFMSGRGQINGITYRNVFGTSADEQAISLNCASCTNIVMENVHVISSDPHTNVVASCNNAQGTQAFVSPSVPCLSDRHPL